jgi:hypothetical protein
MTKNPNSNVIGRSPPPLDARLREHDALRNKDIRVSLRLLFTLSKEDVVCPRPE